MPVARQLASASSHHHHHSSLFSSIGSFFHALQPASHHSSSAVAPVLHATCPSDDASSSELLYLYNAFEGNLAQRLSLLLPPLEDSPCLTLPFLRHAMDLLLSTQSDLQTLVSSHRGGSSLPHSAGAGRGPGRMVDEFLSHSITMLDISRAIKERIDAVESVTGLLDIVVQALATSPPPSSSSLSSSKQTGLLSQGQVRRAKKALTHLEAFIEHDKEDDVSHTPLRGSSTLGHTDCGGEASHEPQRWRSWHGNPSRRHSLSNSWFIKSLRASLAVPRVSAVDVEESLCAAIYAFNVVCVFFLSTVLSALPFSERSPVISFNHPRSFKWALPLAHLQERVQEETRKRAKGGSSHGSLWELDQIVGIVKRLTQVTEAIILFGEFPLPELKREEIKNLIKRLQQHMEELDKDLKPLRAQTSELHNRIINTRIELLDVMSDVNP